MKLLFCLTLLAIAAVGNKGIARTSSTSHASIVLDSSQALRLELARTLLAQTGFEQRFEQMFVQGMLASLNSLRAITEQGDSVRRKFSKFLGEECSHLIPEALTMLAQPFVDYFTVAELQEMINWKSLAEGTGPTKAKFDAHDGKLRAAFESAGAVIGEKAWTKATERLTPDEQDALTKGLSSE